MHDNANIMKLDTSLEIRDNTTLMLEENPLIPLHLPTVTETIVITDLATDTSVAEAKEIKETKEAKEDSLVACVDAAASALTAAVPVKRKYTKKPTIDVDYHANYHVELPAMIMKKHYRTVLVFDTETTGFLPKVTPNNLNSHEMPRIIQLSYVLFDTCNYRIKKMGNYYIKLDEGIQIPPFITEITGITQHTCDTRGRDITEALIDFYNTAIQADCIIAHNIAFDIRMIEFEIERNFAKLEPIVPQILSLFNPVFLVVKNIDTFCTMKSSVHVCNIIKMDKNNRPYKKFPKLCELYLHLFKSVPQHLHNAIIDVIVCLRCFIKFYMEKDIHDVKFNRIVSMAMQLV
jgi:DNA polymerase III epsilon subunit-like protein